MEEEKIQEESFVLSFFECSLSSLVEEEEEEEEEKEEQQGVSLDSNHREDETFIHRSCREMKYRNEQTQIQIQQEQGRSLAVRNSIQSGGDEHALQSGGETCYDYVYNNQMKESKWQQQQQAATVMMTSSSSSNQGSSWLQQVRDDLNQRLRSDAEIVETAASIQSSRITGRKTNQQQVCDQKSNRQADSIGEKSSTTISNRITVAAGGYIDSFRLGRGVVTRPEQDQVESLVNALNVVSVLNDTVVVDPDCQNVCDSIERKFRRLRSGSCGSQLSISFAPSLASVDNKSREQNSLMRASSQDRGIPLRTQAAAGTKVIKNSSAPCILRKPIVGIRKSSPGSTRPAGCSSRSSSSRMLSESEFKLRGCSSSFDKAAVGKNGPCSSRRGSLYRREDLKLNESIDFNKEGEGKVVQKEVEQPRESPHQLIQILAKARSSSQSKQQSRQLSERRSIQIGDGRQGESSDGVNGELSQTIAKEIELVQRKLAILFEKVDANLLEASRSKGVTVENQHHHQRTGSARMCRGSSGQTVGRKVESYYAAQDSCQTMQFETSKNDAQNVCDQMGFYFEEAESAVQQSMSSRVVDYQDDRRRRAEFELLKIAHMLDEQPKEEKSHRTVQHNSQWNREVNYPSPPLQAAEEREEIPHKRISLAHLIQVSNQIQQQQQEQQQQSYQQLQLQQQLYHQQQQYQQQLHDQQQQEQHYQQQQQQQQHQQQQRLKKNAPSQQENSQSAAALDQENVRYARRRQEEYSKQVNEKRQQIHERVTLMYQLHKPLSFQSNQLGNQRKQVQHQQGQKEKIEGCLSEGVKTKKKKLDNLSKLSVKENQRTFANKENLISIAQDGSNNNNSSSRSNSKQRNEKKVNNSFSHLQSEKSLSGWSNVSFKQQNLPQRGGGFLC